MSSERKAARARRTATIVSLGLGLSALCLACGGPKIIPVASCVIEGLGGADAAIQSCEETSASGAALLMSGCLGDGSADVDADGPHDAAAPGHFFGAPCPHDNALGGCRPTSSGVTATYWYYEGGRLTQDQLMQLCAASGGTFISPNQ